MATQMIYVLFACFVAGAGVIVTLFVRMLFGKRDLLSVCSVALGEISVKKRVKRALSYKKPMLWVIIACILLCVLVAVLFLTDPKGEDDASSEFSDESVLEVSDESSEEESFESSESEESSVPEESSEPEESRKPEPVTPTNPEERETTLEKVMSFDIGVDGRFQYEFTFYDDPSGATMTNSGRIFTDGNGIFYFRRAYNIVRLNDGVWFRSGRGSYIDDAEIVGNDLYVLFDDGIARQYDISENFETPLLKNTYQVLDEDESGSLYAIGGAEPIAVTSKTYQAYTLSKKALTGKDAPFVYQTDSTGKQSVSVENGVLSIPSAENGGYYISSLDENGVWLQSFMWGDNAYSRFDMDGNPIARVLLDYEFFDERVRIDLEFEHVGKIYTKDDYLPCRVMFGDRTFEELFEPELFFDLNGTMYFAAYYIDHCEIYRVDAGYTSAEFGEYVEPEPEESDEPVFHVQGPDRGDRDIFEGLVDDTQSYGQPGWWQIGIDPPFVEWIPIVPSFP